MLYIYFLIYFYKIRKNWSIQLFSTTDTVCNDCIQYRLHQMASYKSLITRLDRTRDSRVEGWLYRTFRHVREGQFEITIITSSTKTKPVHSSIFTFISFMQTFISVLCFISTIKSTGFEILLMKNLGRYNVTIQISRYF
jgi:hypothetical protein